MKETEATEGRSRSRHRFLVMHSHHLGIESARRAVATALKRLHFKGQLDWRRGVLNLNVGDRTSQVALTKLVEEAREHGIPRTLYRLIDTEDPYFGRCIEVATDSAAMSLKVEFGSYSRELRGPCRFSPMENEFTDDALFHRRAACEASDKSDFVECTRHYRGFLHAAISLVDTYLNRHALLLSEPGAIGASSAVGGPGRIEDRIDAWVRTIGQCEPSMLRDGPEWGQFSLLRQERNKLVHGVEPYLGIAIRELPNPMNAIRLGVGGLLFKMKRLAGRDTLGFIERLRTAPQISFKSRR